MTGLAARIRRLEQAARPNARPSLSVFWFDQLSPCLAHSRCDVEVETGAHHQGVIHLSFDGPEV